MGRQDGGVSGGIVPLLPKVPVAGSAMNLLIVGDGYQRKTSQHPSQLGAFHKQCRRVVKAFQGEPWFSSVKMNIYMLDVWSEDSGPGNAGQAAKTFFSASFQSGGLDRLLRGDDDWAWTTALAGGKAAAPKVGFNHVIVLVNDGGYGAGAADHVIWATTGPDLEGLVLHEFGHMCDLTDEYDYYTDFADGHTHFYGTAVAPNVDTASTKPKWHTDPLVQLPTRTNNNDCAHSHSPDPSLKGTFPDIGTFEGGGWYRCGIYRPSYTCRMNQIAEPFCKVCEAHIVDWLT